MLVLSDQDVTQLLLDLNQNESRRLLGSLSSALAEFSTQSPSKPSIYQPLRAAITTGDNHTTLFMPVSNTTSTGIKIVTAAGRTAEISGVINVFTPEGRLTGLLSAVEITAFRTALATMTVLVRCPKIVKSHVCIFGAGKQSEWHARLALSLFPGEIKSVTFVNRRAKRFENLKGIQQSFPQVTVNFLSNEGNDSYQKELASLLASSGVIFCCTPATEPLFPYGYVATNPDGPRFFSLIGSYRPQMQEVDAQTVLSGNGKILVDSKEACLAESGELINAKVKPDQLIEVGDLFNSNQDPPSGCNIVFKCVGMGIMDLTTANAVLQMAAEKGIGREVAKF